MRCINSFLKRFITAVLCISVCMPLCACGQDKLPMDYKITNDISLSGLESRADGFSVNLAVTDSDVSAKGGFAAEENSAAGLFDVNKREVLYAKDVHERMNPASLTKIMTAICALKYGNPEDTIICSENITNLESGASTCGLKPGDKLTLDQALHFLLLPSANDAAIAIAEHISGSVEEFGLLMNQEAKLIGATNSNFVNPHGLTDENHYTTVYDMYLITNEAIHYSAFMDIIQLKDYSAVITDKNGAEKKIDVKSSNKFHDGTYTPPENITVLGGKTGTTTAAGSCLALVTRDTQGNPYISVILHASERSALYEEMVELLNEINSR